MRQQLQSHVATLFLLIGIASPSLCWGLDKKWTLYHSWNSGDEFIHRGSISLSPEEDSSTELKIEITTDDHVVLNEKAFKMAKRPGAMYQLKLVETEKNGADENDFLLTSVPACHLLRANLREELMVTLGPHASAISLAYVPLVSPLAPKSCDHFSWEDKRELAFDSKISWETATPGMALKHLFPSYKPPPGITYLPRKDTKSGRTSQGPPGVNEEEKEEFPSTPMGMLRKYWYIIVPLFLMNFVGGELPPPEGDTAGQPQAGGEGGGQASAAAATATAAVAGAGAGAAASAGARRRGKKAK